jgi:hypothetical protein
VEYKCALLFNFDSGAHGKFDSGAHGNNIIMKNGKGCLFIYLVI